MGKGTKGKGGRARRQARGESDGPEEGYGQKWAPSYLQAVDSKWHFGKAALRAYASETGSPFYTKGKSDADHLALHNLLSRLNPSTSEACNRMGVALSEAGGTLEMMARFVDKYLVADPKVTLQKVGLQALAEHMNKDSAKQLRDAACVLNKHSAAGEKPKMSLQEAVGVWVQYFGEDCKEKAKDWQRLARSCATQYVFAMDMLQWLALGKNVTEWAERVKERKDLQPEEVQKWLRGPTSTDRLTAALVASYTAQVAQKAQRGGGLSSEAESSEPAKGKKDKKKRKRSSSSKPRSSSGCSSSKKNKKAKDKKDKAKKAEKVKKSDKQKKKDKKQKKQKTDSSAESGSGATSRQASPAAPAPIEFKLFKTMDEGQKLRVNGKEHKNCCLPLALARATLGEAAGKEEIQAWASDWVAKLPENKQKACRLPAREAELGEALYDDYLQFEIEAAPSLPKVVLLVDTAQKCTKIWATDAATKVEDMQPLYVRHDGGHFTALIAQSEDVPALLKDLPPLQAHSFVGQDDLLLALLKAQKK